mmetsp:Transcript_25771/g.45390  ORF Transcript_25771/g.45390 Transcript_25771/m.45390 type:complete len:344 (-) Transcript_25771:1372-2403(-)
MLCFAITGLTQASVWPGGVAVISNWFAKESRGKVMGFWSSNAMVGNIVGQQVAGMLLLLAFKWELVMLSTCGLLGVSAVLFAVLVRDKPPKTIIALSEGSSSSRDFKVDAVSTEDGEAEGTKNGISFWRAWCLPGVAIYAFGYACVKLLNYAFILWLPYYLRSEVGIKMELLSLLVSLYDLGGIVGSVVSGHISDRIGYRSFVMLPMLALSIPLMGYFRFGNVGADWIFFILVPTVGILTGGPSNIISSAIAADLAQSSELGGNQEALATVTGIIDGTGGFGAALGQTFIGLITAASWDFVFVFLMGIGFVAICTMSPILYREYSQYQRTLGKRAEPMAKEAC